MSQRDREGGRKRGRESQREHVKDTEGVFCETTTFRSGICYLFIYLERQMAPKHDTTIFQRDVFTDSLIHEAE